MSAVVLGKHELFKDQGTGRRPLDILMEVLAGQPVPIIAEFDCSHTHPMLTLPIGCQVDVDVAAQTVTLLEIPVRVGAEDGERAHTKRGS